MKPDPRSLVTSASAMDRRLGECVFIGDSLSDAQAANRAGTRIIALANRPEKRQLFATEGWAAFVDNVHELTPSRSVTPRTE